MILTKERKDELQKEYDELPLSMPKIYDDFLTKRKKLAAIIHEIDAYIENQEWDKWSHWRNWNKWDYVRVPIYCHNCKYPVRLHPVISMHGGKLKKLVCDMCELVHYDDRYD